MTDKEKLQKIKALAIKWTNASEFFDEIIKNDWVQLPLLTRHFINKIGEELLEIIN